MVRFFMAEFPISYNDCARCAYSEMFQDGGGDYDDMQRRCKKHKVNVSYTRNDNKPCKLPEGKYYVALYSVNAP